MLSPMHAWVVLYHILWCTVCTIIQPNISLFNFDDPSLEIFRMADREQKYSVVGKYK